MIKWSSLTRKVVGHVGFFKTYYNTRQSFLSQGMIKDVQKYVAKCNKCQRNKNESIMTLTLLHLYNSKPKVELNIDGLD